MKIIDESTDHYEKSLVANNGLELKLGVVDETEFTIHFFKWNSIIPDGVDVGGGNTKISIQSLYKRVIEPINKYFDLYGMFAIDIADIPSLSSSLRKVRDELVNGKIFEREPDWIQDNTEDRDWLAHALQDSGGEIVFCKHQNIHPYMDSSEINSYEILLHVHQWRTRYYSDPSEIKYNILISQYTQNLSITNFGYKSDDYSSVFITLDKVEEFISHLEKISK